MPANPSHQVNVMRKKLKQRNYDISDADRDALLEMSDQIRLMGPSEYSDHQHEFLLRRNLALAKEVGELAAALESRDAGERLVGHINSEKNNSPETNKDYRVSLRNFGRLLTDGDDVPDVMGWIPGGYPSNYDPAPDPSDMLRWEEDIQPMLDACLNSRDRALIALAWDMGPRPGELFDLQRGAIVDHEYGLQVTLDGKRGRRSPVLIPSVPYVEQWLRDHPGGDGDDLFCGLTSPDSVSNNRIRDILKEVAGRAGVDKPVTPTNYRKSSASYLASQGVSQAHLEDHHGWTRGSEIASRYIAVFDDANKREIARAHGLDVERDDETGITLVTCPRCEKRTIKSEEKCVRCNHALTQEAARKARQQRIEAMKDLSATEGDVADAILTIQEHIGDKLDVDPSRLN